MYKFKIIKKSYGYVIVNETLDTHAHLPTYKGCKILLKLIKNNVPIKDKYLRRSKERLLHKSNPKPKYVNKQRRKG